MKKDEPQIMEPYLGSYPELPVLKASPPIEETKTIMVAQIQPTDYTIVLMDGHSLINLIAPVSFHPPYQTYYSRAARRSAVKSFSLSASRPKKSVPQPRFIIRTSAQKGMSHILLYLMVKKAELPLSARSISQFPSN